MKRKLLSILLTLCLAFSLLPTAALADGEGTPAPAEVPAAVGTALPAAVDGVITLGNDSYVMSEDTTAFVNVPAGVTATLDLGGKTLTNKADEHTIIVENGATLTITGNGIVDNVSHGKGAIVNSGEVTLNGGTFKRSAEKGTYSPYGNGGNSWYTIANYGTMEINTGVTVENAGGYSSMIRNGGEATADCNLTIRGGNFVGGVNTVKNDYFGVLTINGGNFSNTAQYVIMNWNKAEITAGTFRTLDTASAVLFTSAFGGNANYVGKLTISGGEFKHASDTQEMIVDHYNASNSGTAAVTGGKFDADISAYVPNGYIQNENGAVETLGETNAVAKVGGTYYKTLADAVAAAQDGDTVKLLQSCNGNGIQIKTQAFNDKGLTVDFGGNTYTVGGVLVGSSGTGTNAFQLLQGGKVTFKNGSIVGVTEGTKPAEDTPGWHGAPAIMIQNYCDLTLKNMTVTGGDETVYTMSNNHGDVVIEDSTITAGKAKGYTSPAIAFDVCGYSTYTGVSVTVKGSSTINGDIEVSRSSNNAKDVKLALESGTVTGKLKIDDSIKPGDATAITKTENVSLDAPSGYTWTKVGNTGVLVKEDSAAVVNGVGYATLADAINAAGNDDTVTLLKDAELTSTLNLAKNITIDGQGNYTIKAANNFTVGKDKDNKTCCVLYVSGEVTLKDVTVNGNEKCRVIFCDKGKLTIDGATITNGKAPNYIGGVYMTSSASFEMKSGSITGNKNAEGYQDDKYLQYSSDLWIGANANGALTAINGGTIGNVFVNANAWSASNPGSFTMNGGTVTNLYVGHDANYGATFKYNDGTIEHLYLSKENGNGQSIEVTPVKGVIYNGGVKEEDLVTLTLKYNDGATADTTYNVASGTTITLPTPAYRSGYTFNGWYDGSTKVSSPYKVTRNVILTASWSYNYSGGSSSYDPTYSVSTPSKTENGSVTVSPKNASKGDTVTVTVKPDSGYVLETLTVTDKNGNELTLKDKGNGKYTFTMPAGKVEVKATFMEDNSMLNFFYDVPNNAYFYEAVKWAVKNGITTGVGNNLFAPEQPCTRAQIVTFLWRAAGSPEPKGAASGMTDVVSGSYYEKAVAWAIENGITTGTTTSTFSPDATCTRAQAVTFLARALKAKAASAAEFSDVPTDSYFADAVAWAAANGVTEGIGGGLFGSDNDCTRGQIVTFLYRAYNK